MKSAPTIFLIMAMLSAPIVGLLSFPISEQSAEAFVDGSDTDCTDMVVDLLFTDIEGLPDEAWTWVDRDEPFQSVTGIVGSSHVASSDLWATHYSHDKVSDVLVDSGFEFLLSIGNKDDPKDGDADPDFIEIEWEHGIGVNETEGDGADPIFPNWAWPNIGDRIWVNGHWVFDCGHGNKVNGVEHRPTEIHPPRAMASMRDQTLTLPGTGITPVPVVATDLYIHGRGGFMVQQLYCGGDIILDEDYSICPLGDSSPIDEFFEFDIILPPKPHPSAILATFVEDVPDWNTVDISPGLHPTPEENPTSVHVTIPLNGTGVTPDDVYARKIYAGWISPAEGLKHQLLTLNLMDLHEDHEPDPGDCECTFFWLNVDRAPVNEWIRLADFADGDMDDYDDDSDIFGIGDGEMEFTGADFEYYVHPAVDLHIRANGYDQDCADTWLYPEAGEQPNQYQLTNFSSCWFGAGFTLNAGNNDPYVRANGTLLAPDYLCPPGSSSYPTEPGIQYTLCSRTDNQVHLTIGKMILLLLDNELVLTADDEYDLYFTLEDIPLTDEDTSDLGITKTCVPGIGQSFDCTIVVENNGPGLPRNVVVQDTLTTDAPAGSYTLATPTFTIENSYTVGPFDCNVTPPNQFECNLGTVPVDGKATITMTVTASQPGRFDDVASVTTDSEDPDSDNNEAQAAVVVVDIDIKPGDAKNTISISNDNSVRVGILGTSTLDVTSIDVSPLSEGPKFGGSTPKAPVSKKLEDVNKDGIKDLVLMYNEGPKNPLGFKSGDTQGCLTGKLTDGTPILGCDIVRIIK